MDSEIIYSLAGIVIFILIIIFTLRSDAANEIQSKEQKRQQIINEYKKQFRTALEALDGDRDAILAKKSELLKKFSDELSMNIFFDKEEIREIIQDLSKG
jgi:peptidoglycan hydrolase CwlO-like protein